MVAGTEPGSSEPRAGDPFIEHDVITSASLVLILPVVTLYKWKGCFISLTNNEVRETFLFSPSWPTLFSLQFIGAPSQIKMFSLFVSTLCFLTKCHVLSIPVRIAPPRQQLLLDRL